MYSAVPILTIIITVIQVPCGPGELNKPMDNLINMYYHEDFLSELLQSHSAGDFCIIGPKGCGKSITAARFASLLGYTIEPIVLYQVNNCIF